MLLILDIDETIIHTTREWIGHAPTFVCEHAGFIHVRPGLQDFLESIRCSYSIAVWSAGTDSYVESVTSRVLADIPLVFSWTRSHCEVGSHAGEPLFVKDLDRVRDLGIDLAGALVVDDRPAALSKHPDNVIAIKPYFGGKNDNELHNLPQWLDQIKHCVDVRLIDKSAWRESVAQASSGAA